MTTATYFRRPLPEPPAVDFASAKGKAMFKEALACGTMENFFRISSTFSTQDEPAFCGLSSLAVTLNALSVDPGRTWKGVWRWFHERMLDCCEPLEVVEKKGIVFDKVVCLAKCNGASVDAFHTENSSVGHFRERVLHTCTREDVHMVVSYDRRVLKQSGIGHFSPIGGYHQPSDSVLILDVARFKYPPHWVPLPLLFEAMQSVDADSGKSRGFMLLTKPPENDGGRLPPSLAQLPSPLLSISCRSGLWYEVARQLTASASPAVKEACCDQAATPRSVASPASAERGTCCGNVRDMYVVSRLSSPQTSAELLQQLLLALPMTAEEFVVMKDAAVEDVAGASASASSDTAQLSSSIKQAVDALLGGIRSSDLFQLVEQSLEHSSVLRDRALGADRLLQSRNTLLRSRELYCILLLLSPSGMWKTLAQTLGDAVSNPLASHCDLSGFPPLVRDEIHHLRAQLTAIVTCC